MIDFYFNELVNKNNILLDESNILDMCCVENLNQYECLKICQLLKYGYIVVTVDGLMGNILIKYNGLVVKKIVVAGEYIIPISFVNDAMIEVYGISDKLVLKLYGAKFNGKIYPHIMPLNNLIQFGCKSKKIYSYTDYTDITSRNYTEVMSIDNNIYVQSYIQDGAVGLGMLDYNNGLDFSNSFDNYVDKINITTRAVDSAMYIQNYSLDIVLFIYLSSGKSYYRIYNTKTKQIGEETNISTSGTVMDFISPVVNTFDSKVFGIVTTVGVSVYILKSNLQIEKVYESKVDGLRILQSEDFIKFVVFDKYTIRLVEFVCDDSKVGSGILQYKNSEKYANMYDVLECNKLYIYTNFDGDNYVLE